MAINIFSLMGSIMVDSSEAENSIKKTSDGAKNLASTLGNGIKTAGKWAAGIGAAAVGAATAMGTALSSAVNDTAEYADEIDKASLRSGLTADNLQRLKYAAEQSGAELEKVEESAKTMNERLVEVAEGNQESADMFKDLGVSVRDTYGNLRDSNSVYNDVLTALADMGDCAKATAIGTDLFGEAFVDLKPLLAAGSDGINDLKDNADKLGIVMSQDAVKAGVAYGDTVANIKSALGGAARSIGTAVLPMFQRFADKLIEFLPKIQSFFSKLIPVVERLAESIIEPLMEMVDELFPPLMDFVESLIDPLSDMISSVLPVIIDLFKKLLPIITEIIQELLPPLLEIMDGLMPVIDVLLQLLDPVLELIKGLIKPISEVLDALAPVVDKVVEFTGEALKPLQDAIGHVSDILGKVLGGAFETVCTLLGSTVIPAFQGVMSFLSGDFLGGIEGYGQAFTGIFESVFSGIDAIFGTHLSEWYNEFNGFWMDVGSKLYQLNNKDLLEAQELSTRYSDMQYDLNQALMESIKAGATAEEAMEQAKSVVLDTTEKMYAFEQLEGNKDFGFTFDLEKAQELYDTWHATPSTTATTTGTAVPKLARGGLAYGDTLAQIGDNPDAYVNPEVVSPLSDLTRIISDVFDDTAEKIAACIAAQMQRQPINATVVVRLSDDTELTRAIIRNINDCTRQDGKCVIKGI